MPGPPDVLWCADLSGEQAQKPEDSGPGSAPRSYVLKPIDGRLLYLRRGKDVRQSEEEAIQEADITLQSISLHLSSTSRSSHDQILLCTVTPPLLRLTTGLQTLKGSVSKLRSFTCKNLVCCCRGAVSQLAEAARGLQLVLGQGAQPLPAARL